LRGAPPIPPDVSAAADVSGESAVQAGQLSQENQAE
jgi:hypothetical protein